MSTPTTTSSSEACCCKCVDAATHVCLDCDLSYCGLCCDQRHRKGSFQRHTVKPVEENNQQEDQQRQTCDECLHKTANYQCAACELAYCDQCSKEVHRNGKLQGHIDAGYLTTIAEKAAFATSPIGTFRRDERILSDATDDNVDYDLWGNWSVFRQSTGTNWTNPASDDYSSSSDDEMKSSSISSAFKNLALSHSSSPSQFTDFGGLARPWTASDLGPPATMSQNDVEDLFTSLESPRATRHVLVRSVARHLSTTEVKNISHIMHSFGEVAQVVSTYASQGLVLYTYYELKAAVFAVQQYQSILAEDPSQLSVCFSNSSEAVGTNAHHGIVDVEVKANSPNALPSTDQVRQFCNQFGEVASVTQADFHVGHYRIEFNDTRDVPNAILRLKQCQFLGDHFISSVELAPIGTPTSKLIPTFSSSVVDGSAQSAFVVPTSTSPQPPPPPVFDLWSDPSAFSNPAFFSPAASGSQYGVYGPPAPPPPPSSPPQHPLSHHGAAQPQHASRRPTHSATHGAASPPENEFSLGIDRVHKGEDQRTTLMIRNIPNKYTQTMLLAEINQNHQGQYDFFYLPIDFKNKCNMGYAFINFMEYEAIVPFYEAFNGQKWRNFNSEKVCAISYARLQGKAAMIARFQNSSLLEKHESYRPLVFKSSGPDKGTLEQFPPPRPTTTTPMQNGNGSNLSSSPSLHKPRLSIDFNYLHPHGNNSPSATMNGYYTYNNGGNNNMMLPPEPTTYNSFMQHQLHPQQQRMHVYHPPPPYPSQFSSSPPPLESLHPYPPHAATHHANNNQLYTKAKGPSFASSIHA